MIQSSKNPIGRQGSRQQAVGTRQAYITFRKISGMIKPIGYRFWFRFRFFSSSVLVLAPLGKWKMYAIKKREMTYVFMNTARQCATNIEVSRLQSNIRHEMNRKPHSASALADTQRPTRSPKSHHISPHAYIASNICKNTTYFDICLFFSPTVEGIALPLAKQTTIRRAIKKNSNTYCRHITNQRIIIADKNFNCLFQSAQLICWLFVEMAN